MKRKLHILIATIACLTMGNQLSAQTEVVYNFNRDLTGIATIPGTDGVAASSGGSPAVSRVSDIVVAGVPNTLPPILDNGVSNTSGVLRMQTRGEVKNLTTVSDLIEFPSNATDYSITWKQYITLTGTQVRTGFMLRATDATATPVGASATTSVPYGIGIKKGYLVLIEKESNGTVVFRVRAVDNTGAMTSLKQPSGIYLDGGTTAMAANKAYWFRVSISGVTITFDYSLDGVNFTRHNDATYTDSTPTRFPASGSIQLISGIGVGSPGYAHWYMDNVTFSGTTTTSTSWDGSAWSSGAPSATSHAVVTGTGPISSNITAATLTVRSPAVATVASGNNINVTGAVTVNAGANLILENNAKLIQTTNFSNTGNISVKRNAFNMVRFDYTLWSSPVSGQNLFNFSPNTVIDPIVRFYGYNTASNQYDNTGLTANSSFVTGKGYAVRAPNVFSETTPTSFTGTFTGVPNNGSLTVGLDATSPGFNLVGNPYPSPIDAAAFVTANSLIDGTLYFYSHNAKSDGTAYETSSGGSGLQYATWNGTGGVQAAAGLSGLGQNTNAPNGTIQVGQGFIVKANSAGNLTFTNAMRTVSSPTANSDQFFKLSSSSKAVTTTASSERHRLWLDLNNDKGVGLSQLLVGYVDGATDKIDTLFDGEEFGNPKTSLSSFINGKNYTIQGRALPFTDTDVIPLAFKAATAGSYTIGVSKTDGVFATNQEVLLKDNSTGKVINLKNGSYTFSATAGTANSRFELLFSKATINPADLEQGLGVVAIKKQGINHINTSGAIMKDITVYDIQGKEVLKLKNINSTSSTLSDLQVSNRVFIVKVTTDTNQTQTIKIIN